MFPNSLLVSGRFHGSGRGSPGFHQYVARPGDKHQLIREKKGGTPGFYSAGYGPNHCSIQFVSEETLQGAGTVGHVQSNVNSMLTGAFPLCGKFGLWITFV